MKVVDDSDMYDGSFFARRVVLVCCVESLGIDYELVWRYMDSFTSLDWFFLKLLVVFAQSLEKNMKAFLSSTFKYLTESPSLRNLPLMTIKLGYCIEVISRCIVQFLNGVNIGLLTPQEPSTYAHGHQSSSSFSSSHKYIVVVCNGLLQPYRNDR